MATRVYRETVKIPISITWHQELVDDGPGGKDFYMRITPHINLGGKSGMKRLVLSNTNKNFGSAFWPMKDFNNVLLNGHRLESLSLKMERDLMTDSELKAKVAQHVTKGARMAHQQKQTASTIKPTNQDTHAQALERTRRQHGISLEDEKAGASVNRENEVGEKATTKDMMSMYGKSEKDVAFINQMLGHSTANYDAVMKEYNETKVGYDDDDYDL